MSNPTQDTKFLFPPAGGPPPRAQDVSDEARRLSALASPGILRGGHRCDGAIRATIDGERVSIGEDIPGADAALWALLTNAYRAGLIRFVEGGGTASQAAIFEKA